MKSAVLLSLLLAAGPLVAQSSTPDVQAFTAAAQLFQKGSAGDSSSLESAISAFDALVRANPDDPLCAVYHGSALTMKARTTWAPWNKVKYVEQGLDDIDRALRTLKPEHDQQRFRGNPVSLETQIVAARTFLSIPDGIFHRRAAGRKLINEVLARPDLASASPGLQATAHFAAAQAARDEQKDAEIAELKQVVSIAPESGIAGQARARLKELGS